MFKQFLPCARPRSSLGYDVCDPVRSGWRRIIHDAAHDAFM